MDVVALLHLGRAESESAAADKPKKTTEEKNRREASETLARRQSTHTVAEYRDSPKR